MNSTTRVRTAWLWLVAGCAGTGSDSPKTTDSGLASCEPAPLTLPTDAFFTDISEASGIQEDNFTPEPETSIPINDHSRLAFVDINGDGFDDIVMHSLYPNPAAGIPFEHLVFPN